METARPPLPAGYALDGDDVLVVPVLPYRHREEVLAQLRTMVACARALELERLLADTHPLGPHIDVVDRILLGARMSQFWPRTLRTAIWCSPMQVNHSRPFEQAATREGHRIHVDTDRAAALAWLRSDRA